MEAFSEVKKSNCTTQEDKNQERNIHDILRELEDNDFSMPTQWWDSLTENQNEACFRYMQQVEQHSDSDNEAGLDGDSYCPLPPKEPDLERIFVVDGNGKCVFDSTEHQWGGKPFLMSGKPNRYRVIELPPSKCPKCPSNFTVSPIASSTVSPVTSESDSESNSPSHNSK